MSEQVVNILTERLYAFTLSLFIFACVAFAAFRNGYFSFSRPELYQKHQISLKELLVIFALFLFLQLLVAPLTFMLGYYVYLGQLSKHLISSEVLGWLNIYGIVVTSIGLAIYFFSRAPSIKRTVLGDYAEQGIKTKLEDFFIACVSWVISYPLVVAVGQLIGSLFTLVYKNVEVEQMVVKQIKSAFSSEFLLAALSFCILLIVPFVEELLFRGYLQNWLKTKMNTWKAILLTSVIFAFFHFAPSQGYGNVELIISLFILSCFLGYIYERQKSLWAPISLHAIFNGVSVVLIFFMQNET